MIQLLVAFNETTPIGYQEDLRTNMYEIPNVEYKINQSTGSVIEDSVTMLVESSGDYVGLLSDNDVINPAGVASLVAFIAKEKAHCVWSASSRIGDSSTRPMINLHGMTYAQLLRRKFVPLPLFVARREYAIEAMEKAQTFVERLCLTEGVEATRVFNFAWRWELLMLGNTQFFGTVCCHRRVYQDRLDYESHRSFCQTQAVYQDKFRHTFA